MTRPSTRTFWETIAARRRAEFLVLPGQRMSYAELGKAVRRWLHLFDSHGIAEGDRIVLRTTNELAMVSGQVAALLDGIVPVSLGPRTPDQRVRLFAQSTGAKTMVLDAGWQAGDDERVPVISLGNAEQSRKGLLGLMRGSDALAGLPSEPSTRDPRLPEDPDALGYILFTSGTTSSPSGVMVTRGNLFAQLETMVRIFGYGSDTRLFNDMALSHADGLVQGPMLALAAGGALIRSGGFRLEMIEDWLNRVRQERATHVIAVPTIWAMIDSYAAHDDYFDAPECQALLTVAAKLPDKLWLRLEERFKRPVYNQYGLTETVASALYAGPAAEMGPFGTIGKPIDCDARIDPVAASDEGELQLRGENVFPGYWKNERRTRDAFTDDGWMKTGDLAKRLDDGSYKILGRCKRVILTGGFLVSPEEIDEALSLHPAVTESVTIAFEDEVFEEFPVTGVVCRETVAESELVAHLRQHLEDYKIPKRIVELEAIPRGDSGKPLLQELRAFLVASGRTTGTVKKGNGGHEGSQIDQAVLALAEDVFHAEPGLLSKKSRPGDIPGWDSFSQLSFVLAVEREFGLVIPASRIAGIATIADMIGTIEDLRQ